MAPNQTSTAPERPAAPCDVPRILIVDDSPGNLALFKLMLRQENIEVHSTTNGPEALTLHARFRDAGTPFSLLILDWSMPALNGLDVARRIRQSDTTVKIAFLTSYYEVVENESVKEVNAELWAKPIVVEALAGKVRRALSLD